MRSGKHRLAEHGCLPSRNMYRGTPQMYSLDGQALEVANSLVVRSSAVQHHMQLLATLIS